MQVYLNQKKKLKDQQHYIFTKLLFLLHVVHISNSFIFQQKNNLMAKTQNFLFLCQVIFVQARSIWWAFSRSVGNYPSFVGIPGVKGFGPNWIKHPSQCRMQLESSVHNACFHVQKLCTVYGEIPYLLLPQSSNCCVLV